MIHPDQPNARSRSVTPVALAVALGLGALPAAAAPASPNEKIVIEAGTAYLGGAEQIENAVIVVEDGRITQIGTADEVQKPWDAPVFGGPDHVAFPGFVEAHANSGMDRSNENIDVTPFLDVRDSIDPINLYFEDCLRWGTTTVNVQQGNNTVIAARGRVVRPTGMTVEEMTVRPLHGIKLSASPKNGKSRATQAQALRAAFDGLRRYLEEIVDDARQGGQLAKREALFQGRDWEAEDPEGRAMQGSAWTVDGLELIPRGAIDEKQAPLLALVEGRLDAYFYCAAPREVHTAIDVARENGFLERTTFVLGASCWKAADVIAATGRPVILDSPLEHAEIDDETGEETRTFVPGVFAEKGIPFALSARGSNSNSLGFQAARAVALGMDAGAALDAVTRMPAELIGLGDDVGSLAVGKLGNVLLLTGEPLGAQTWVDHAFIEGRHVYDRSQDTRNKYIFEGQQPVGAGASDGPGAAGPITTER
ncbi:MAG: amidohydrolase family protein [Planctomycetota bacterium]